MTAPEPDRRGQQVWPEHAPDHPTGVQAGPHGRFAYWCKRTDCDWRYTTGPKT